MQVQYAEGQEEAGTRKFRQESKPESESASASKADRTSTSMRTNQTMIVARADRWTFSQDEWCRRYVSRVESKQHWKRLSGTRQGIQDEAIGIHLDT